MTPAAKKTSANKNESKKAATPPKTHLKKKDHV